MEKLIDHQAVSVIMPVYNAEPYVAEAVESILNQTFNDFEFIIINDGSTDRSLEILLRYANQDQRIRLVSRENKGLVATLNEGLALAKAPLIARMDADDVAILDRLESQFNYLNIHTNILCVGGYSELIDENGRALTLLTTPTADKKIQELLLKGHVAINHPATMFRKEPVLQIGAYRLGFESAQDLDLWLRLGEIGQLANMPKPLIKYRFLANSISGKNINLQRQCAENACQQAWQRRGITSQFEFGEWRPLNNANSRHQFLLKFGWWAFNYRQRHTALIYGLKSVWLLPFNKEGWRLLLCALIKPLPIKRLTISQRAVN